MYKKFRFLYLPFIIIMLIAFFGCEKECLHKEFDSSEILPTCNDEGYTLNSCKNCSYEFKSDFVSPSGHTLNEEIFAPLCEKEGYTLYSCECGYSYKSSFTPPTGHTFSTEKHYPTCTSEGYTKYRCNCGYEYKSKFSLPLGHTFTSAVTPPTCSEAGHTKFSCSVCKYSYISNLVPPTNHTIKTEITHPTSSSDGYTRTFCEENCGYEYISSPMKSEDVYRGAYANTTDELARGIDVSKYNGDINWSELKSLGIDFVIIKAGSVVEKDPKFEENYKGAKAAGLDVGCYFYSYALNVEEALDEAELFKTFISGKKFEYPIYFDIEDKIQEPLDGKLLTDICVAFIEEMQRSGYFCGLYTNYNWLTYILETERLVSKFDVWFARWFAEPLPEEVVWPTHFGARTGLWQYFDKGVLGSHSCNFDLNIAYKNYPALIKGLGLNGF